MIGSAWRKIGELGRAAAALLAVAFVSMALSGAAQAKGADHNEHHAHHHSAPQHAASVEAAAPEAVAGHSSSHETHAQAPENPEAHPHDGECHCQSASCGTPVLMPEPLAQMAERVVTSGHAQPPVISAEAQAVFGPQARPPRA